MAYNKTNNDAPELIEKVVYLNRVSKTVKGGRVMKFSALVVAVSYTHLRGHHPPADPAC